MQNVSKALLSQPKQRLGNAAIMATQTNAQFSEQPTRRAQLTMATEESKHRVRLPLYDLRPRIENCWVAPNSTIGKSPLPLALFNMDRIAFDYSR